MALTTNPSQGQALDVLRECLFRNPIPSLPSVKPALRQETEINFNVFKDVEIDWAGQRLRDHVSLTAYPLFFC